MSLQALLHLKQLLEGTWHTTKQRAAPVRIWDAGSADSPV